MSNAHCEFCQTPYENKDYQYGLCCSKDCFQKDKKLSEFLKDLQDEAPFPIGSLNAAVWIYQYLPKLKAKYTPEDLFDFASVLQTPQGKKRFKH